MSRFRRSNFFQIVPIVLIATAILNGQSTTGEKSVTHLLPKGWVKYDVAGQRIVSRETDQKWISDALTFIDPIKPRISDINLPNQLSEKRDLLTAKILRYANLLKPEQAEQYIDKMLVPKLKSQANGEATIVYYILTEETIKQALIAGWKSEIFSYNEVFGELTYSREIKLDSKPREEIILPATFNGTDAVEQRQSQIRRYIQSVTDSVQSSQNARLTLTFLTMTADFLAKEAFGALPQQDGQEWFVAGLSYTLAIGYLSDLTNIKPATLLESLRLRSLPTGILAKEQNLLAPLDLSSVKNEYVALYREARKRKAISVVFAWYSLHGPEKLQEVLTSIERLKPADGETIVRIIKDVTGDDLTNQLSK